MDLSISVHGDTAHPLLIECDPQVELAELSSLLKEHLGMTGELYLGSSRIVGTTLADSGLRQGSIVGIGAPKDNGRVSSPSSDQVTVSVSTASGLERRYTVSRTFTVGRSASSVDLAVDDNEVSRRHAEFRVQAD